MPSLAYADRRRSSIISDPEQYKAYMAAAPAVVQEFGGEYLVRGGRMAVLEGDWTPPRLTVLRFPSFEAAQAMLRQPRTTARARELRAGATDCFNMMLVEGVDAPPA